MFKNYSNYEIYEDGRIWSYKTKRFLKLGTNKDGYQIVSLSDNEGNSKMYLLHRVVYEAVTGKPIPKGYEINHISEDKTENKFESLNLLTHKENCNFGTRNDRISKTMTNGKTSKAVGAFQNGNIVMTFSSTQDAERNGFNSGAVSKCCRNCFNREGNNVYKGYTWRFI